MKVLWCVPLVLTAVVGIASRFSFSPSDLPEKNRRPLPTSDVAADGVVEGARPEMALRPEVAGTIAAIPFRENAEVRQGELLIELRNDIQKHRVELAQAEVAAAKALALQSKSEAERTQKLGASVLGRERCDADRFKSLHAQAQLDESEARLRLAQAELARTRIVAPVSGRILRVHAEPGEQAGPASAQPVLLLADVSKRRVRAWVEELDANRVHVGQRATVTADGLPERSFPGTVALVLPRMGKRPLHTDAPEEYRDLYYREIVIDLENGAELALNLRVKVRLAAPAEKGS